ncbi:TetR/AcrR family transcriptional regulator [Pseudonocardia acidicola]|uniref:TetR/AcrR family transcriptional regulator n=1 Tax=Pseudonocardia acidicola TaxID=2724939 RepID=A0ABX1SNY5_9PSEU|nr:TetR/AcrR family transcriptional regulator [Pseudonocardia acidicola]NMI01849.1 TetR/AcrR family transcriptional regulator [Pseudonocardia acidicola]
MHELPARREDPTRPGPGGRRAQLATVAGRLFRERGYHAVGMRMIAEAADIRAASLYHHFRSKEELLLQVVFRVNRDLIAEYLPLLEGPGSYADRLGALVRAHILHIWNDRDAWWLATRELRALSPAALEQVQVDRRYYQHRIADFIAAGVAAGEFACADPRLTTLAVLDMINGLNEWFSPDGRYTIDELSDRYVEMVVSGLAQAHRSAPAAAEAR